jgi:hypothetical protein
MVGSLNLERDDLREKLRQEDALILVVLLRPLQEPLSPAQAIEHEGDRFLGLPRCAVGRAPLPAPRLVSCGHV